MWCVFAPAKLGSVSICHVKVIGGRARAEGTGCVCGSVTNDARPALKLPNVCVALMAPLALARRRSLMRLKTRWQPPLGKWMTALMNDGNYPN